MILFKRILNKLISSEIEIRTALHVCLSGSGLMARHDETLLVVFIKDWKHPQALRVCGTELYLTVAIDMTKGQWNVL